jgi:hypothetical protein
VAAGGNEAKHMRREQALAGNAGRTRRFSSQPAAAGLDAALEAEWRPPSVKKPCTRVGRAPWLIPAWLTPVLNAPSMRFSREFYPFARDFHCSKSPLIMRTVFILTMKRCIFDAGAARLAQLFPRTINALRRA